MEPITTELRKLMTHTVDGFDLHRPLVECDRETFERLCDEIDAVHEGLERENESLRRELDRVLGELDEMHKTDGISDNSSSFMHNAEHHAWAPESHYVMLPKDADGVPIHVGDVMEMDDELFEVRRIELDESGEWTIRDRMGVGHLYAHLYRHYHASTVEDVLREFADAMSETHPMDVPARIAEYAAKLRLAGDAE